MTQIQKIQTELNKAGALLNAATDLLNDGSIVSIASLKDIIGNICSLMKEDGYADCQAFGPVLTRLSVQMDMFCAAMEQQMKNREYLSLIEG